MNRLFKKVATTDSETQSSMFNSEFLEKFDQNSVKRLGPPGMNIVLQAKNKLDDGLFALKIISATDTREYDNAIREVRMLRELEHPNILRYFFSWVETPPADFEGYPDAIQKWVEINPTILFIQTEFWHDGNLENYIKNGLTEDIGVKMGLFGNIVSALCYIHSKNKIHRDLKPENVFLKKDWTGKLCASIGDFGLTRNLVQGSMSKGGTQKYCSPEQLQGTKYTEKTDIFPLGIIWFELLYCNDPSKISSIHDIILSIRKLLKLPEHFCLEFSEESGLIHTMIKGAEEADTRPSAAKIAQWLDEHSY